MIFSINNAFKEENAIYIIVTKHCNLNLIMVYVIPTRTKRILIQQTYYYPF